VNNIAGFNENKPEVETEPRLSDCEVTVNGM
jgi:hypothetical protein